MTLLNFLYLNESLLDTYISQIEDGVRSTRTHLAERERTGAAKVNLKVAEAGGGRTTSSSDTSEYTDSAAARFTRLLDIVETDPQRYGWRHVLQAADVEGVIRGEFLDATCEIYESDITQALGSRGLASMLPLVQSMQAWSPSGSSLANLPNTEKLDAMSALGQSLPPAILQGEIVDTDWSIVGSLEGKVIGELDGDARVIGKISRIQGAGTWKPLPGLPIISQMPREQRREYERTGPEENSKNMWVQGPALHLDILAVVR